MVVKNGIYYLYRHIRLDKNVPFYIGIGKKKSRHDNHFAETIIYSRAYSKDDRNCIWNRIVNKTDYEVEIIYESDSKEEIKRKEVEFIALYGRRDLGKGTLVNLTDGGDGMNMSKESLAKMVQTQKEKGYTIKSGERLAKIRAKFIHGTTCQQLNVFNLEGKRISKHPSIRDCCKKYGIDQSTVSIAIRDKTSCCGYFFSKYDVDSIDISEYKLKLYKPPKSISHLKHITESLNEKKTYQYDVKGDLIKTFKSMTEAAESIGVDIKLFSQGISRGKGRYKGYNWVKEKY